MNHRLVSSLLMVLALSVVSPAAWVDGVWRSLQARPTQGLREHNLLAGRGSAKHNKHRHHRPSKSRRALMLPGDPHADAADPSLNRMA